MLKFPDLERWRALCRSLLLFFQGKPYLCFCWEQSNVYSLDLTFSVHWLCCAVLRLVIQSCLTLCDPMDCSPPGSSVHGDCRSRILKHIAIPSSRGSSQPRDRRQVSCTAGRFFTIWAKVKNTGVGSLSLLQGIFLTQESNWGLQHCRWILYQLSYPGTLYIGYDCSKVHFCGDILLKSSSLACLKYCI